MTHSTLGLRNGPISRPVAQIAIRYHQQQLSLIARTDKAQGATQHDAWVVPIACVWQPAIVCVACYVVWVALSTAHKKRIANQPDRGRVAIEWQPGRATRLHQRWFSCTANTDRAKTICSSVIDGNTIGVAVAAPALERW